MSPRYVPKAKQPLLGLEAFAAEAQMRDEESRRAAAQRSLDPYRLQHSPERFDKANWRTVEDPPAPDMLVPSFWYDLLLEALDACRRGSIPRCSSPPPRAGT
jgi:hypothetical protein